MVRLPGLLLFFIPLMAPAQDAVTSLLSQAGQMESAFRENEALAKYKQVLVLQPSNVTALCKCSDLSCRIGARESSKQNKTVYFKAGKAYADAAYRLAPGNCEVNIAMAFSTGRMALIMSGKDKVVAAGDIKRYAENAIRADPNNFKGYHILGRWHYEVSNLNALERMLAKWFYGALPEASLKEAIANYEKSMRLAPDFLLNYLELAKACHRDGANNRALQLLRRMDGIPNKMLDDTRVRVEGKKLLEEWE
jgi:hypothetical protein